MRNYTRTRTQKRAMQVILKDRRLCAVDAKGVVQPITIDGMPDSTRAVCSEALHNYGRCKEQLHEMDVKFASQKESTIIAQAEKLNTESNLASKQLEHLLAQARSAEARVVELQQSIHNKIQRMANAIGKMAFAKELKDEPKTEEYSNEASNILDYDLIGQLRTAEFQADETEKKYASGTRQFRQLLCDIDQETSDLIEQLTTQYEIDRAECIDKYAKETPDSQRDLFRQLIMAGLSTAEEARLFS